MRHDAPARGRHAAPGYRLCTAEILYRLPDHPALLQSYIWQELDLAPGFPVLGRFLRFWRRELEGELHSVRVAAAAPGARWRNVAEVLTLH